MRWCKQWLFPAIVMVAVVVSPAYAQSGTSSITGTVTDNSGGVIPGATVVVTPEAGESFNTVSNSQGQFTVPSLKPGVYKVTVTLQGFKTAVVSNVRVISGSPAAVSVKLEIGALSETVTVRSTTELVNTQNATVSSTLDTDQLNRMPTVSRNALNAVTFLPGVNVTSSNRAATVNGLPQSMLNITLDGVSNQDNFLKSSDGFFASVYPRQDAVESVTVTSAVAGASLGGSGSVTIAFTTRSGTNQYTGSGYEYWRRPQLNSNNWVNERNGLPKNQTKLDQYGARLGGPIKIPGLYDGSGKAFFFFHYEELRFPNSFTRTRSLLNPASLDGTFFYTVAGATQSVNVMAVAAANGQLTTFDPIVLGELNLINNSTKTTGVVSSTTNPLVMSYAFQSPATLLERQPTGRVDYNITSKHRFSASASSIWAWRTPDYLNSAEARFPGAPNYRVFASTRPLYSFKLRSTLSANLVNEVTVGLSALGTAGSRFGQPSDPSQGAGSFADIGGYAVVVPLTTDWWTVNSPSWRAAPARSIDDNMNWQRGSHSFNIGGSYLKSSAWEAAQQIVPQVNLGMVTASDPANGMFSAANFPNAASGDLTNAKQLYATLTGRITSINGQIALDPATNKYVYLGPRRREGYIQVFSAFGSDSWKMTPTVTLTAGARWDLQTPFVSVNNTMSAVTFASVCGMSGTGPSTTPFNKCGFSSLASTGATPEFIQLSKGTKGYNTDWNNVAPSLSLAWRPNVKSGFMRTLLGDPEQATVRGGYSVSYERQGINVFTSLYGGNPGATVSTTRNASIGNLVDPVTGTWPLLYSQKNLLGPPPNCTAPGVPASCLPDTVAYPIAVQAGRANSINAFAPDIKIANSRSWSLGFSRSIGRDMAAEVRYVGTRGVDQWSTLNYNTRDIEGNGFLSEFKLAVANLQANNLAGGARAGSFAYFGAGTGTAPLPIYLAYLNGQGAASATNAALYTGVDWTNSALTQDMIFLNPSPTNSAADLDGDATRRGRALAVGLPVNLFVLNPAVGADSVTDSGAFQHYDSLQLDVRRRLSRGLSASVSYVYQVEAGSSFDGFKYGRTLDPSGGQNNIRHAIKPQFDWTIPVGRGQRFGTNWNKWLDGIAGGWSFKGVGRFQAQAVDFGNVRLVGMTKNDLQAMYKNRRIKNPAVNSGLETVFMLPDDVIVNTRRAFSISPTTIDGYSTSLGPPDGRYIAPANYPGCIQLRAGGGECAPRTTIIISPWFARLDIGLAKRIGLSGRRSFEIGIDILNVFDNINFTNVANPGTGSTIFSNTSGIYQDPNNTYDPGGRLGQISFRINW
jgi:hypothetical protein